MVNKTRHTEILFFCMIVTLHFLVRLIQRGLVVNFNPDTAKQYYNYGTKQSASVPLTPDVTLGFPLLIRDVCG